MDIEAPYTRATRTGLGQGEDGMAFGRAPALTSCRNLSDSSSRIEPLRNRRIAGGSVRSGHGTSCDKTLPAVGMSSDGEGRLCTPGLPPCRAQAGASA